MRAVYLVLILTCVIEARSQSARGVKGVVFPGIVSAQFEAPIKNNRSLQMNLSKIDVSTLDAGMSSWSTSFEYRFYRLDKHVIKKDLFYWMLGLRLADGHAYDDEFEPWEKDYRRASFRGGYGAKYNTSYGLILDTNLIVSFTGLEQNKVSKDLRLLTPMVVPTFRLGYSF